MVVLSQYVEITSGFPFKSNLFINDSTEIPLIKGENLQPGYIDWEKSKYWPRLEYEDFKKYHLLSNDVVLAMDRPWVPAGLKWTYIKKDDPKSLLVQRVARLRTKDDKLLSQFYLRYIIGSPLFKSYIDTIVTGINVPHISGKQIGNFKFELFDITKQKKIAAILSTYDDLIDVNKKRIEILENMAEELYKEWFVRFRFPNWENTEFEKGIPKEWKEKPISKCFEVIGGGTPSKDNPEYWRDGDINWFTPSDLTKASTTFVEESSLKCNSIGLAHSSTKLFPAYSVMMTSRATIGVLSINTTEACTNQGFITCLPNKEVPLTYLYYQLKFSKPHFEALASGATFPELSKGVFKKIKIRVAEQNIIDGFDKTVKPLFEQILNYQKAITLFQKQKDSLLPRLMSGNLSVADLNIQYPPSMHSSNEAEEK